MQICTTIIEQHQHRQKHSEFRIFLYYSEITYSSISEISYSSILHHYLLYQPKHQKPVRENNKKCPHHVALKQNHIVRVCVSKDRPEENVITTQSNWKNADKNIERRTTSHTILMVPEYYQTKNAEL